MDYAYFDTLNRARQWAENVMAAGRLSRHDCQAVFDVDTRGPDSLFAADAGASDDRPLIVAFMGGTGVGKSSLLNRLAGQAIARAGAERPTSREVTLYHHQSLSIRQLPSGLPLDSVSISQHHDAANSHIVWMDMPDFDSIEQGNRRMVLEWLPHIDVLIYVVSPERYRDGKAWQILLAEGLKHAWLFVMNQWDRGQTVQYADFIRQLHLAGFADPLVFRTSCMEPEGDEFAELLRQLQLLSGRHCMQQLEERNRQQRSGQLGQILQAIQARLAAGDFRQLENFYSGHWQKQQVVLQQGLAWPLRQYAGLWAGQPGQKPDIKLWDDWAQGCLCDMLDELVLLADQLQIPARPLKTALQAIAGHAEKRMAQQMELAGRSALLNPGNALQRFFLTLTGVCETLLPLLAMAAVGYQVFLGYYRGAAETGVYLGTDFAVHSVLLIGLSWLIPFFLHQKIRPSLQKAALSGLQKGLQQGLLAVDADIRAILAEEQDRHAALRQELAALITACQTVTPERKPQQGLLARVLVE
ncbi:MAG: GTPase domain-containing protein [Methylococcales bacterium]|nr:GTPase domain-containing protein [Methylococcales bacterium]